MKNTDLFRIFNVTPSSPDHEVKEAFEKLLGETASGSEKEKLQELYKTIDTREKRYIYKLTSDRGFSDLDQLDEEIISRPNYVGPGKWMNIIRANLRSS